MQTPNTDFNSSHLNHHNHHSLNQTGFYPHQTPYFFPHQHQYFINPTPTLNNILQQPPAKLTTPPPPPPPPPLSQVPSIAQFKHQEENKQTVVQNFNENSQSSTTSSASSSSSSSSSSITSSSSTNKIHSIKDIIKINDTPPDSTSSSSTTSSTSTLTLKQQTTLEHQTPTSSSSMATSRPSSVKSQLNECMLPPPPSPSPSPSLAKQQQQQQLPLPPSPLTQFNNNHNNSDSTRFQTSWNGTHHSHVHTGAPHSPRYQFHQPYLTNESQPHINPKKISSSPPISEDISKNNNKLNDSNLAQPSSPCSSDQACGDGDGVSGACVEEDTTMSSPNSTHIQSPKHSKSINNNQNHHQSHVNEKKTSKDKDVDLFQKLKELGNESDRCRFADNLQLVWEEYQISHRALPNISKAPLDLYRLYMMVRDKGGFDVCGKMKYWKEICNVLNVGHTANSAFNLKKRFVSNGLFHYECKFDRGGVDPLPFINEMDKSTKASIGPKSKSEKGEEKEKKSTTKQKSSSSNKNNSTHASNLSSSNTNLNSNSNSSCSIPPPPQQHQQNHVHQQHHHQYTNNGDQHNHHHLHHHQQFQAQQSMQSYPHPQQMMNGPYGPYYPQQHNQQQQQQQQQQLQHQQQQIKYQPMYPGQVPNQAPQVPQNYQQQVSQSLPQQQQQQQQIQNGVYHQQPPQPPSHSLQQQQQQQMIRPPNNLMQPQQPTYILQQPSNIPPQSQTPNQQQMFATPQQQPLSQLQQQQQQQQQQQANFMHPARPLLIPQRPPTPVTIQQQQQQQQQQQVLRPTMPHQQQPQNINAQSQQQTNVTSTKTYPFPADSIEATQLNETKKRKLMAKDITPCDPWRLYMCLKSGLLAESTYALDALNILLYDDQTIPYFHLKQFPGLLNVLLEYFIKCLKQLFKEEFNDFSIQTHEQEQVIIEKALLAKKSAKKRESKVLEIKFQDKECKRFYGFHKFSKLKKSDCNLKSQKLLQEPYTAPYTHSTNTSYIQTHMESRERKILSNRVRLDDKVDDEEDTIFKQSTQIQDNLIRKCMCVSTIFRNLSFVPGNDLELWRHETLMKLHSHFLTFKHVHNLRNEMFNDECDQWWHECVTHLRENSLVLFSNIGTCINLSKCDDSLVRSLSSGLLHLCTCKSSECVDTLQTMSETSLISAQKLSIEILSKMTINEFNLDLLLAKVDLKQSQLDSLLEVLSDFLSRRDDQTLREFAIVILNTLTKNESLETTILARNCSNLIGFIEDFEEQSKYLYITHQQHQSQVPFQLNEDVLGTSVDMLRRCATCLFNLTRKNENLKFINKCEERLLELTMSNYLDLYVGQKIAQCLYLCTINK